MKHSRIVFLERGGPEVLQLVEEEIPEPMPDEVRVRVLAAGVSAFDLMVRSKSFPGFPKPPFTPGIDVVGVVVAVGPNVTGLEAGRQVAATTGPTCGGYAEHICLPARDVVPVPPGVDPVEAVCVVANYITASLAIETAGVGSGDRVLIQGAAGGVGSALLELGKLAGFEMYGTASLRNHELVARLGARPIDYRSEDVVARVRELTGDGVDAVFDPIGGVRQIWRSYRCLRSGGRLVWFGVAASSRQGIKVIPLSLLTIFSLKLLPDGKRLPMMPNAGGQAESENAWYRDTLGSMLDHLAAGKLEPIVAARFPLAEAARAHEFLEEGGYAGKVVLSVGE